MPYKRLIETVMPVSVINRETEREKTARTGLPSSIHIWWSRRPMAAARSTLFASLVDDPAEHPELFATEEDQAKERERLLHIAEDLAVVENASNAELLKTVEAEILRYEDKQPPVVFDPFSGGGGIPIEAHRLGLGTISSDLNAVAAMITTVGSDIPTRFHDMVPVHPQTEMMLDITQPGARGFSEDVRFYGEWVQEEAQKRIGHLYPRIRKPDDENELDVSAWIWARTVKCPNPSCGCNIPLFSSNDLAKKKGSEAWVEPVVENGNIAFRIHREQNTAEKGKPKVARTAVFKCPVCGEITPDAYIKECGIKHEITSQLIAIVADDGKKRLYLEPTEDHKVAAKVRTPEKVPHGALPIFPQRFSPPSFGLSDYADLFTDRQLVFITTMMNLANEVQAIVEKDAIEKGMPNDGIAFSDGGHGALAYAQAVRITLVLTISKLLDRCSNLCSWSSSSGGALRNVFSRAAMPMIWDYAEGNPFADAGGSYSNALHRTCEAIAALPVDGTSKTYVADCTLPNSVRNAMLSTELPFYDKASYADLSDFFYVWLKYGLEDLYPDYFKLDVSPKKEELTAFTYRWNGDRQQANAFYAEGMNLSFRNLYESVTEDYPSTVAFQYKRNDSKESTVLSEWEAFVTALCNAGFMITASWPLARKYESSIELAESRGIPITVVIRKRPVDALQTTRRSFVAAVKRELPVIVDDLQKKVSLMDIRSSVIGQALNIYSRYSKVLDADGTVMKPQIASRIIEQELDTILTSLYKADIKERDMKEESIDGRES